jgi:hypothetical protein
MHLKALVRRLPIINSRQEGEKPNILNTING